MIMMDDGYDYDQNDNYNDNDNDGDHDNDDDDCDEDDIGNDCGGGVDLILDLTCLLTLELIRLNLTQLNI